MASSSRWLLAAMALPALSFSSGCGGPPRGEPPRPALSSRAPEIEPEPDMEGDAPNVASADLPSLGVERLRLAWRAPKRLTDPRERWVFGSDATRVVAQSSRGVVSVIDARTGKVTELSGRFSWGDASDHQRALVLGDTVVFSDLERGLTALGLDTGAIRWRRDAPIVDVAATEDALFARTRSGVVRALDANGSEKWRLGVGEGVSRGLWPIPGLPGGSGLAYVDEDGGRARLNVLVRKPETQEASTSPKGGKARIVGTVRVNGALARHLTILVNDDKTRTDALGRFSIEVAVPGKYTVHPAWAELPPPRQDKFDFPGMCCGRGVEGTGSVDVEPREGERAPADLDLRTTCHACRP